MNGSEQNAQKGDLVIAEERRERILREIVMRGRTSDPLRPLANWIVVPTVFARSSTCSSSPGIVLSALATLVRSTCSR